MFAASRLLSVCVLFAAASALAQDRRPLTHDDYDQWKSLRATAYSQDGAWVAWQLEPQQGDGVLEVREVDGTRSYRHDFGSSPRFSADGRFVVFTQGTSKVAERDKKIAELRKKAKEGNKPSSEGAAARGGEGEAAGGPPAMGSGGPGGAGAAAFAGRGGAGGRRGGAGFGPGGPGGPGGGEDGASRDRGELMLLDLATGKVDKLGKVKGSLVSDDVPFLLIHKEKPEAKPDAAKPEASKPAEGAAAGEAPKAEEPKAATGEPVAPPTAAAAEPAAAEPAAEAQAGEARGAGRRGGRRGPGGAAGPAADPIEAKRPEGTDLLVRDLATGSERTIADVVAYGVSRQGKWLWYHTSAKKPAQDAKYGLFVQPLAGGDAVQLLDGIAHVGNVTIDRAEAAVAFTSDKVDFAADKPASDLYLWEGGSAPARRIAWAGAPGMPPGKRVAGGVSFTRDGRQVSFDVNDPPAAEPLPILPEDKVTLDLWNWRDGTLQTAQQKRGNGERNPEWTAVWQRGADRLAVLGDDGLRSLRFVGPAGNVLIGNDGRAYEKETTWDGRYTDVWLVDAKSGQRTRVLERLRGNVSTSPQGKYLLWFSTDYHWWSLDIATGVRRDLTGALPVPFHQHDDDHPEPDSPYGIAGWTKDDGAVLLHDEFDVWSVPPDGSAAVCVTDGFGRANRLRLRVQQLPRSDDREWVDDELLLATTHVDTMAEGFHADSLVRAQKPQRLVMADVNFGDVMRPKHASRLFFTQSTFAQFADLWTAASDFRGMRRLSDANPQQKNYRWGKAELVHWIDGDGNPRQGVLVKPDDFDPTKKYPMMVHFYERMTQGLHSYVAPAPGTSPNASYYVSNGYLWFMPDVVYEIGYPGNSCVKCVVSGVQHLVAQGFVDSKAIAASGHSWGGYQTAFLVTRTNIFACVESGAPVSNMLSAYGGIRYESGVSRQFQYEQTQSRIGGTPWQYPLRYQENSPIHFADKVQTPVLMLHNDQDGAVPWTQGIEYFTALRRLGKECYLFNYNGEGHGLRNRANMKDWSRRMAEYFDHHCKGAPAPKWMQEGVPFHERETEKLPFAASYIDAHVKPAPAAAAETTAKPEGAPAGGGPVGSDEARGSGVAIAAEVRSGAVNANAIAAPAAKLQAGQPAPDFALTDAAGKVHTLADHRGRMLLVWFCPKADMPSCITQAEALRDQHAELVQRGADVLGVAFDPTTELEAMRSGHALPFPMLRDADRKLAIACGAADDVMAEMPRRIAVLIDGAGKVVKVWTRVNPRTFAEQALQALPL